MCCGLISYVVSKYIQKDYEIMSQAHVSSYVPIEYRKMKTRCNPKAWKGEGATTLMMTSLLKKTRVFSTTLMTSLLKKTRVFSTTLMTSLLKKTRVFSTTLMRRVLTLGLTKSLSIFFVAGAPSPLRITTRMTKKPYFFIKNPCFFTV